MRALAESALTLLIIFVGLSMIIGGKKGTAWAINVITAPIRGYAERRIRTFVLLLVAIVVLYFLGVNILHR